MIFSSFDFMMFFLALLSLYLFAQTPRQRAALLLVGSFIFYGSWKPAYLILLIASLAVNYGFHLALLRRSSRVVLASAVVLNLAVLCWFKYLVFFTTAIDDISCLMGDCVSTATPQWMQWVLPLGISFFTFQMLSAHIDTYRKEWHHRISFYKWCLYVSFFPQLIAGPIVRPNEIIAQLNNLQPLRIDHVRLGLLIFCGGLIKKALFADNLAAVTDDLFNHHDQLTMLYAWLAATSFGLQIYFDFSGYSEMALGLALMFGVTLPRNFIYPYISRNVSEFWQRWHVTLSSWLRDYLYIGLGGSRKGPSRTLVNLMLTMLLGGLWHGAGWNFIVWGGLHGLALIVYHLMRPTLATLPSALRGHMLYSFASWLLTMIVVWFSWVLFRAESLSQAVDIMLAMMGLGEGSGFSLRLYQVLALVGLSGLVLLEPRIVAAFSEKGHLWRSYVPAIARGAVYAGFALCIIVFGGDTQKFIYFDF